MASVPPQVSWKTRDVYIDLLYEFEVLTLRRLSEVGYLKYVEELTEPLTLLLSTAGNSSTNNLPKFVDMGLVIHKILGWYSKKGTGAVEAVPPQPPVSDSSRLLDLEKLQRVLLYAVLDDFTHLLCTIYRGCRYNAGMGLKQLSQFLVEHGQLDAVKDHWPETLLPEQPTEKVAHEPAVEAKLANEEEPAIDGEPAEEEHPAVGKKLKKGIKRKRDLPRDCKRGKRQRGQPTAPNAVDTSKPKRATLPDRVRALEDRNEQMSILETNWEKEKEALLKEIQALKKDNKAKVKSLRAIKVEQEDQQQLVEKIKSLGSEKKDLRAENKKLKKRLLETGCDMKKVFQKLTLVED